MVSRWCVSSCVGADPSCSLRQSYSWGTCEAAGRNEAPCEPRVKQDVNHFQKETPWNRFFLMPVKTHSNVEIHPYIPVVFCPVKTLFNELVNIYDCPLSKTGKFVSEDSGAQFRGPYLNLRPGGGGEVTIWTLKGVSVQVRPLVVLHIGASVERLHAYSAGKPFGAQTRRANRGWRGWSFTAQLTEKTRRKQRVREWKQTVICQHNTTGFM